MQEIPNFVFWGGVSTLVSRRKNPLPDLGFARSRKHHLWLRKSVAFRKLQIFRGEGYTRSRMRLLWWKETGTPWLVKPDPYFHEV